MTIKLRRIFDALYMNYHYHAIKLPLQDEISYDELNAWYKTRLRNHKAITIFFHALAILLTGPFFHLFWFTVFRKVGDDPNWLMRNWKFRSAHLTLVTIKEQLDNYHLEEEEILLSSTEDTISATDTEMSAQSDSQVDELREVIAAPQQIDFSALLVGYKDIRNLLLNGMDDKTLIETFIRPVYKKGREYALQELFSRSSKMARQYCHYYLRFHLSYDSILKQPLSSSQLAEFSQRNPNNLGIFSLVLTARVKFGDEDTHHVKLILDLMTKISHTSQPYDEFKEDLLRCKIILKGIDILDFLENKKSVVHCLDGDITQVNPHFRDEAISYIASKCFKAFKQYSYDELLENDFNMPKDKLIPSNPRPMQFEKWTLDQQRSLMEKVPKKNCHYSNINFDQLNIDVLNNFIDKLLTEYDNNHYSPESVSLLLSSILKTTKNNSITQRIMTGYINHGFCFLGYKTLYHVKYDHLSEYLKRKYLAFLCEHRSTDLSSEQCKAITALNFSEIGKYQDRLMTTFLNTPHMKFRFTLLTSRNFFTLSEENQNALIDKTLPEIFSKKGTHLKFDFSTLSPYLQNIFANMAVLMPDATPIEYRITIRILCNLDLKVIEFENREIIIEKLKDELLNPKGERPLFTLLVNQLPFIQLNAAEQTQLAIYLRDYLDEFYNQVFIILGSAIKFNKMLNHLYKNVLNALQFLSTNILNNDDRLYFFMWLRLILRKKSTEPFNKKLALKTLREFDFNSLADEHKSLYLTLLLSNIGFRSVSTNKKSLSVVNEACASLFALPLYALSHSLQNLIVTRIVGTISNHSYNGEPLSRVIAWVYRELPTESDYRIQIKRALFNDLNNGNILGIRTLKMMRNSLSPEENRSVIQCYYKHAHLKDSRIKLLPSFWFSASNKEKNFLLFDTADKRDDDESRDDSEKLEHSFRSP